MKMQESSPEKNKRRSGSRSNNPRSSAQSQSASVTAGSTIKPSSAHQHHRRHRSTSPSKRRSSSRMESRKTEQEPQQQEPQSPRHHHHRHSSPVTHRSRSGSRKRVSQQQPHNHHHSQSHSQPSHHQQQQQQQQALTAVALDCNEETQLHDNCKPIAVNNNHQHKQHHQHPAQTYPRNHVLSSDTNMDAYFRRRSNKRSLPECRARQRIQGTRGNGAIRFFIDLDTPGGHCFPLLALVRGVEFFDNDSDDKEKEEVYSHEPRKHLKRTSHSSTIPRRPPTPPKASHKRSYCQNSRRSNNQEDPRPRSQVESPHEQIRQQRRASNPLFPPELPQRQASTSGGMSNPSHERSVPHAQDSETLAETLENSAGSQLSIQLDGLGSEINDYDGENNDRENDDDNQSSTTFEQHSRHWESPNLPPIQTLHPPVKNHSLLVVTSGDEEPISDNDGDESSEEEETSDSEDDIDDHVKGYIHNYVQTHLQPRRASAMQQSYAQPEEEQSIDPLAGFVPRCDMSEDDSLADIQDSFAVASMNEHSAQSVDYGYNQEEKVHCNSATSISAEELEPETLAPVIKESPVATKGGVAAGLRRSMQATLSPKQASKQTGTYPANPLSTALKKATQQSKLSFSSSNLRRSTHTEGEPKQTMASSLGHAASDMPSPRTFRGSKKTASKLRQPSMAVGNNHMDQLKEKYGVRPVSIASSGRLHNSVGSGPLQHSQTSNGSSDSGSSAACKAINPYTMPESALDQSMAFIQFDFRSEAGFMRCETNGDVQVAESSEDGSIDEFDASALEANMRKDIRKVKGNNDNNNIPSLNPVKRSDHLAERAPPKLPVRHKTNEDIPSSVAQSATQRGLRGLVRNFSSRDGVAPVEATLSGKRTLVRSRSTDNNSLIPMRGLIHNLSSRAAGRLGADQQEKAEENKRPGLLFRTSSKAQSEMERKHKFFFGYASSNSVSIGNRFDEHEPVEDDVSLDA